MSLCLHVPGSVLRGLLQHILERGCESTLGVPAGSFEGPKGYGQQPGWGEPPSRGYEGPGAGRGYENGPPGAAYWFSRWTSTALAALLLCLQELRAMSEFNQLLAVAACQLRAALLSGLLLGPRAPM